MNVFVWLLSIFLVLIGLICFHIKNKLLLFEKLNIPHIKPRFFYGNTKEFRRKFLHFEFFQDFYNKFKSTSPLVGAYVYFEPIIVVTSPELIKCILLKNFDNFPNRGIYHDEIHDPSSAHLVNIEDENWKNLRNKMTPTFTSGKLKMMLSGIESVADNLMATLHKESKLIDAVNIKSVVARFTTDVIGKVAFGIDCNSLDNQNAEFYYYGNKIFSKFKFFKIFITANYPKISKFLRIRVIDKEVSEFYKRIIQETIKYREENKIEQNDFMSLMINLKNSPDPATGITFNQIWAQSAIFFLAGYETTATTITYFIYELSNNLGIQEKARKSVREVLDKFHGKYSYDAISEMKYLEQCVMETLRKYPPFTNVRRVAKNDFKVPDSNIVIKKGMFILVPVFAIHYDSDIYPEPNKFDPERFSSEELVKRHNFTFLPFGEGPRICIGERFAIVEVKLAMAKLLMNYEFILDKSKTNFPLNFDEKKIILTAADDIFVKFKSLLVN